VRDQIVCVKDCSKIKEKTIVLDSTNNRRIGGAEFLRDGVGGEFRIGDADDDRR